jgi:hypothetical protein
MERLSPRDNAEEITAKLSAELTNRVAPTGVQIIETRLTRLSYAPEAARRCCACSGPAQSSARGRALSKARWAWSRRRCSVLSRRGVVELDEERKAAMVSNLLMVPCSEQATQQVENTGSLYQ